MREHFKIEKTKKISEHTHSCSICDVWTTNKLENTVYRQTQQFV
jgi:hypothetical protein